MPAPNIILDKPLVLIQENPSVLGITPGAGKTISFGTIENVYNTSDKYAVGDYVGYVNIDSIPLMIDSESYLLIDEKYILFKEITPP